MVLLARNMFLREPKFRNNSIALSSVTPWIEDSVAILGSLERLVFDTF